MPADRTGRVVGSEAAVWTNSKSVSKIPMPIDRIRSIKRPLPSTRTAARLWHDVSGIDAKLWDQNLSDWLRTAVEQDFPGMMLSIVGSVQDRAEADLTLEVEHAESTTVEKSILSIT